MNNRAAADRLTERAAMDANAPSNKRPTPFMNQGTGKNTNMATCDYDGTVWRTTCTTTARTVFVRNEDQGCTNVVLFFSMPFNTGVISTSLPSEKHIQMHVSELRREMPAAYTVQQTEKSRQNRKTELTSDHIHKLETLPICNNNLALPNGTRHEPIVDWRTTANIPR